MVSEPGVVVKKPGYLLQLCVLFHCFIYQGALQESSKLNCFVRNVNVPASRLLSEQLQNGYT